MRKVLLFVALFGVGLAVLLLLAKRRPAAPPSAPPGRSKAVTDSQFTRIPLPPEGGGKGQDAIRINQQGALDVIEYEQEGAVRRPIRELHAKDSHSLGGNLYVLRDMTARILDPATGQATAEMSSPTTRLRLEIVDGKLHLGEGEKAVLSDVTATIHSHAAITPLTFTVPLLEWRVASKRWLSDGPVDITGSGLKAHGEGLDADLEAGGVVLQRSGKIELTLPGGTRADLTALGDGPIEFRTVKTESESLVQIVASKSADLSATGEEPSHLKADTITLLARGGTPEKREFELVSVDAEGHVVAESRGDTFRADKATFRVTPQGRLQHVDLSGSVALESAEGKLRGARAVLDFAESGRPEKAHVEDDVVLERGEDVFHARSADFSFDPDGRIAGATLIGEPAGRVAIGRYLPPGERELRAAHAELTGAGPLVLDFTKGTNFRFTGPGDLRVNEAEFQIHAEKQIDGRAAEDHRSGTLDAAGGVVARLKNDDLESETVHVESSTTDSGEALVVAQGSGLTILHRKGEDGSAVTVTARDGLSVRSSRAGIVVPLARGVAISATGPKALEAHANIVQDFDWDARSFRAEGDVSLEGEDGRGSSDRAVARGEDDIELTGITGRPARYARKGGQGNERFEEASIQGLSIHAKKDSLDASGEVLMDFATEKENYHVQGGEVHVAYGAPSSPEAGAPRPFEAHASNAVRAQVATAAGESALSCERLLVSGMTKGVVRPGAAPQVGASQIRAESSVSVDWRAEGGVSGEGDLFTVDPEGRGRLSAEPGKRIHAKGRMAGDTTPYSLEADWMEFETERFEARHVDLEMERPQLGPQQPAPATARPTIAHMTADHLLVNPSDALLEGSAHVDGRSQEGEEWVIDAGSVKFSGAFTVKQALSRSEFDLVKAWGGFRARLGSRAAASGRTLEGQPSRIRLEGEPAELVLNGVAMRSAWIEYDAANMLLATDKGEIGPPADSHQAWSIEYESLQPFDREDKSILALRNPVYRDAEHELRAMWTLFWVDREEWRRSGQKKINEAASGPSLHVQQPETPAAAEGGRPLKGGGPQEALEKIRTGIGRFRNDPFSRILSEAYIEGNIELSTKGQRVARASAVYLDIVDGHGWVRDADVLEDVTLRDKPQELRIRAEWMRVNSDMSLRADKATLTFCGYDQPHYVVETSDLRLQPGGQGIMGFDVSATGNTLRFENGWAIPLPPLKWAHDEEGNPILNNIAVGKSAKFGASIGASVNVGLGKVGNGLGGLFANILSLPKVSMKGNWRFNADYLGTRGILLGTGLELRSGDVFRLDAEFSLIPDRGEDRGLIRVPTDDRSFLRDWFRMRGRYTPEKNEWFDLVMSRQSDPGVQSEFFERDFFHYEQKDNYLHWRKANGEWYFDSSVKVRLENRTDIDELPSFGAFRGRAPIGKLFGQDILYTGTLDADYLRRREGDPNYYPTYPDAFGDRDVARADTVQRLETPFSLGFLGLRATPWTAGRATVWDRGVDPDTSPSRVGAFLGLDLSTTLWKRYGGSYLNTITPYVSAHGDIATRESDGTPVHFDRTEDPIEGKFVDVGFRTRIWKPGTQSHFDADIFASHGSDLPNGQPDGFQPIEVLAEMLTWVGSVPFGVTHDGRYDTVHEDTVYSRTYFGFRPARPWDVEFGYNRGVDPTGLLLYEAATVGTRYRISHKWEVEAAETVSTLNSQRLDSVVTLRRLGHDFVTEIQVGYVAGEGSRFSINLTPLITYKPSGIGLLDRWLGRD